MSWPSDQDYNEALQDLALNCGDALLRQCAAVRNPLGLLMPYSGNFADVYEVRGPDGRKWAVKCFKRNTPGLHARYQQIDAHLRSAKLPFTVPFAYVEQGLRIRGQWSPLVRMEWVEGQRLNDFVSASLEHPQRLDQLAELWPKVAQRLQAAQVAHADLQHGNVLLVPREDGALSLKLIDYDGMYVPAFAGQRSPELGHACFQHPQRARDKLFNAEVDRFSHLVIFTALRCLRVDGKNLWQRYENGDNLLFRESDFAAPGQSELLKELWALPSRSAHAMVGRLVLATQQPLAHAPWLHEVVQGREIAPLAPADESRVQEILGRNGAAPAPPVPAALQGTTPLPGAGSRPTPLPVPLPAGSRPAPQPIPLGQPGNTPLPIPMPPVAGAGQPAGALRPVLVNPSAAPAPVPHATAAPRTSASPAWLAALQRQYRGNRRLWHAGLAGAAGLLLLLAAVLMLLRGGNPPPVAETPAGREATDDAPPAPPIDNTEGDATSTDHGGEEAPESNAVDEADTTPSIAPVLPPPYRLQQTLLGHTDVAEYVAIRPDGRVIATGGWDQTVNLWDAQSGELLQTLLGDKGWVVRLAFSADGRLLASGGDDAVIRLWDAESFALLRELSGHARRIRGLQFTRDGQTLVSGCEDKSVRFWDVATGTERSAERLQVDSEVTSLALSPTERRLAAGCYDGSVHLWDLDSRSELPSIGWHAGEVSALAFNASGELLASAGHDNLVKVWDVATGELRHTLAGHGLPVMSVAFHPGGRVVASGSMDATIIVWDVETGEQLQTLSGHTEWVSGLAFNADGMLLVSVSHDESVKRWTTDPGGPQRFHELLASPVHQGPVYDVAVSLDGIWAATCGRDGRLCVRQIPSGKLLAEWQVTDHAEGVAEVAATGNPLVFATGGFDGQVKILDAGQQALVAWWPAHGNWATALACSPDGSTLVSGGWDNAIRTWELGSIPGQQPQDVRPAREIPQNLYVDAVAYSPDGTLFASAQGDGSVQLFVVADPAQDRPLTRHNGTVRTLDFSPDGQTLASAGDDGQLRLTDVRTGESQVILPHELPIRVVAYSLDGALLVSGSDDGTLKLWDATTRALVQTLSPGHGPVHAADFTPDGQILVSGHEDGTVVYWELRATAAEGAIAAAGPLNNGGPAEVAVSGDLTELRTLSGHGGPVSGLAFSPDGRTLASGSFDGEIKLWEVATGANSRTLTGHLGGVYEVGFALQGTTLASVSEDNSVVLWNVATGEREASSQEHENWVVTLAVSPDGRQVASGSGDQSIIVWDAAFGESLRTLRGHSDWVYALDYSPDGQWLASGSQDQTIILWDLSTDQPRMTLRGHTADVRCVAFSPDGRTLASGGGFGDDTVNIWDVATGECTQTIRAGQEAVESLAFSPDGRLLVTGGVDHSLMIYDVPAYTVRQRLTPGAGVVRDVVFSSDGRILASAHHDGVIKLWGWSADARAASPAGAVGPRFAPAPLPAEVIAAAADATVPAEYRVARTMTHAQVAGEMLRNVTALAYSPDGRLLASGSEDKTVRIWEPATGAQLHELADHAQGVLTVAFHPDCRTVASGGYDQSVKLWDATTGELLHTLVGHDGWVSGLAFSPDGTTLASASDDATIKLWTVATGELQQTLQGHAGAVQGLAYTPDGRRLVSASYDQTVKVWNLVAGAAERDLSGHAATEIAISPDGTRLATGGLDKSVILWELATGLQQEQIEDYADFPEALAFSPNGRTLAVASWDPSLQLLDPLTGAERQRLSAGTSRLIEVAFSPAGRALATGAENGTITLWEAVSDGAADETSAPVERAPAPGAQPPQVAGQRFVAAPLPPEVVAAASDATVPRGYLPERTVVHESSDPLQPGIAQVVFSPAGELFATLGGASDVHLWSTHTGELQQSFLAPGERLRAIAFHPDGRTLAMADSEGVVRWWDYVTDETLPEMRAHSTTINDLAISPDGTLLATAGDDFTIQLWDVPAQTRRNILHGHEAAVAAVAFAPDGQTLLSASADHSVRQWDVATGQVVQEFAGHSAEVDSLAVSRDGTLLATGAREPSAIVWDLQTGRRLRTLTDFPEQPFTIGSLAFSPNGMTLAVASSTAELALYDPASGELQLALPWPDADVVAFSPDGRWLASDGGSFLMRDRVVLWGVQRSPPQDAQPPAEMTFTERLQQRISFTVEMADRVTFAEAVEKFAAQTGIPVQVLVDDLKLEGITQNQTVALDERDQPAGQILRKLLLEVDARGEVVSVVRPTADGSGAEVVVTTRAAAAARGETVTDE